MDSISQGRGGGDSLVGTTRIHAKERKSLTYQNDIIAFAEAENTIHKSTSISLLVCLNNHAVSIVRVMDHGQGVREKK
jgi:hypothetical protein